MVTLQFSDQELQILRTALTQSRAEWSMKSTNALLAKDMEKFDVLSTIYAQTVDLDNRICSAK